MTTTDAPGLREAAEALKDHAWLERFRNASYQNKYHELSPSCANQISGYVDDFLNKILATHPSDGGEAITEEWLREIGWTERIRSNTKIFTLYVRGNGVHLDLDVSIVRDGEIWHVAMSWWRDHFSKWPRPLTTRPQLLHLLAALGHGK